jgi:N-acetylmuramoyl-L-alanine amidase
MSSANPKASMGFLAVWESVCGETRVLVAASAGRWGRRLRLLLLGGALVSISVSSSAATYGQEVLAAVLLAEARGEGEVGMRAVAEVVRQRADANGVSMLLVLRPGAFSSLNGTDRDALLRKFHRHKLFPLALEIARTAYNRPEAMGNLTRGANHFTHKRERPYWSVGHRPVVTIGNHAFYRLPTTPG